MGMINDQQSKQFCTVLQVQEAMGETTCNVMAINDMSPNGILNSEIQAVWWDSYPRTRIGKSAM